MKRQNKLVLLSSLFAAFGLIGCGNDSASDSCGLTEDSCQSINKTLDDDKCVCVEKSDAHLCSAGKHVFDNACEDDSLQNCSQHGFDCTTMIEGWSDGNCLNSACEATPAPVVSMSFLENVCRQYARSLLR